MVCSMTGFGEATLDTPWGQLRGTVKTVNHRFFNAHLRTPPGFDRFEADVQAVLKQFFARGHVNLTLSLDRGEGAEEENLPQLDRERARHYARLLQELREEASLQGQVDLSHLLRFGDVFTTPDRSQAEKDMDPELIREVVREAAAAARRMREEEGGRLREDLEERLQAMDGQLKLIQARAPERLSKERDRLRAAIQELSGQEEVDEDRLAKEIAYLAERWDINEELVRMASHLAAFRSSLSQGQGEPVGKRLGFLVQEMHREANTISSKANDVEIGHASVALREEIERLREQLENVE